MKNYVWGPSHARHKRTIDAGRSRSRLSARTLLNYCSFRRTFVIWEADGYSHLFLPLLARGAVCFTPCEIRRGLLDACCQFFLSSALWLNVCNGVWIMHSVIIRCSNARVKHLLAASLVTEQWFMSDWVGSWGRCALRECSNEIINQVNICTRAISLGRRNSPHIISISSFSS